MGPKYYPELDLLRGLAVVMMIANHIGFGLLSKDAVQSGTGSACIEFGGFAPVLFFFTTGIVAGLQCGRVVEFTRVAFRVIILLVADMILTLTACGSVGFDFLAFIGLSTLLGYFMARSRHGVMLSLIGFVAVAGMRFIIGTYLKSHVSIDTMQKLNFFFGTESSYGLGYPLAPWLCYPFLGFFLSDFIRNEAHDGSSNRLSAACLVLGMAFVAASVFAVSRGASFARYTTVSAAYFSAGLGAAFLSLAVCRTLARTRNPVIATLVPWFETRGIACLSVVPIHYMLLEVLKMIGLRNLSTSVVIPLLAVTIPVCLVLGRSYESCTRTTTSVMSSRVIIPISLLIIGLSIIICYVSSDMLYRICGLFFGQMTLCLLLADIDGSLRPAQVSASSGMKITTRPSPVSANR